MSEMERPAPTPQEVIRDAIWSICSDGNSDPNRVALDILRALNQAGYRVMAGRVVARKDRDAQGGAVALRGVRLSDGWRA